MSNAEDEEEDERKGRERRWCALNDVIRGSFASMTLWGYNVGWIRACVCGGTSTKVAFVVETSASNAVNALNRSGQAEKEGGQGEREREGGRI